MIRALLADLLSRFRDRRRSARQELEELFDRQTFVTILFLGPTGKAIELWLLGKAGLSLRFAGLAGLGVLVGVYWKRLAQAAETAAEAAEDAVDPDS